MTLISSFAMGELISAIVVALFYAALAVGALILTECFLTLGSWLDERKRKARIERLRRQ
jgi:uncharacterized membrane protein YciS (DUF1049 family)